MSFTLKVCRSSGSIDIIDIGHEPDIQVVGGTVQAEITTYRGDVHKVYAADVAEVLNKHGKPVHVFDAGKPREFVVNGFDAPPAPSFGKGVKS